MTAYHWLAAFVAVNVLDMALTLYGLKRGAYEVNPLLRLLMRKMPAVAALALTKSVLIVSVALLIDQIWRDLPWAVAVFGLVCAWNAWQIGITKRRKAG
jgi:predicted membrane protein